MKKEAEMKSNVLQQLIEAMLGETSNRVKPKMVSIEIVKPIKKGEGESLEEVLNEAAKESSEMGEPVDVDGDGDHDMDDHKLAEDEDEDEEEKMCSGGEAKKRMSLQEFLSRK